MKKGAIVANYSIACGRCGTAESLETQNKSLANIEQRKRGWKMKQAYGFVCPACLEIIVGKQAERAEKAKAYRMKVRGR